MTGEALQAALGEQPFRPFSMWLSNGRSFTVSDPGSIRHHPGDQQLTRVRPDGTQEVIELAVIRNLEFHGPLPAKPPDEIALIKARLQKVEERLESLEQPPSPADEPSTV